MKRGQVTPFIAIVLAMLLFLLAFYSADRIKSRSSGEKLAEALESSDVAVVKSYVDNCVKQAESDGLLLMGIQGGYAYKVPIPFQAYAADIGYGYYEGVSTLPSLQTMGNELSGFVEKEISLCIKDFEPFRQQGYSISPGKPSAEATFSDDSTIIDLNWHLEIIKGTSKNKISSFSASVPVRFRKIYEAITTIVVKEENEPEYVDISYLKSTGLFTVMQPINDDVIVFALVDNESKLFNNAYLFMFANKFQIDKLNASSLSIKKILQLTANVGEEFVYRIEVSSNPDSRLVFSSASSLFAIDGKNGTIKFTPTEQELGEHFALIEVADDKGNSDERVIRIEVVKNA